jgi:hypothetical protein
LMASLDLAGVSAPPPADAPIDAEPPSATVAQLVPT